jgi:hypothetical protein
MNEHAMKPIRNANVFARPCGALLLTLMLASCGGGGGDSPPVVAPPAPPAATQSLTLTGDASQVLAGGKTVTLTATPAVAATVAWSIDQGPGTLSATSGASVTYTPPAGGVSANTPVLIKASAGDVSKTYRVTVYPDPGKPGLSLIAGALSNVAPATEAEGTTATARFIGPRSITADLAGNLYVLDDVALGHATAYKITPAGIVTRILDSTALDQPGQILAGPDGTLYITQIQNLGTYPRYYPGGAAIHKLIDGTPQLFVGTHSQMGPSMADGQGAAATFYNPELLGFDADGNLYAVDGSPYVNSGAAVYRKITPQGLVSTVSAAPAGLRLAPDGQRYYASSSGLIYRWEADGSQTVVAGTVGESGYSVGPLPGKLIDTPLYLGSTVRLAITPTGPGSFAVVSGNAILKLVLPH